MAEKKSHIYVLAGTNGAGKSSIGGAMLLEEDVAYFNPDEATRRILAANPETSLAQANSLAWNEGRRLLERAIEERLDFAFETTLGGHTITALLQKAAEEGIEVRIWFVGLASPELHMQRVRSRVEAGGHDIPEQKIRERYNTSRANLIDLLPWLAELRIYDNSAEADPKIGSKPRPKLMLHMEAGKVVTMGEVTEETAWVKPILAQALKVDREK